MKRAILFAVLAVGVGSAPAEAAEQRCDSGRTLFVDGKLRIFAITFHEGRYGSGSRQYACLGRERRPLAVGRSYSDATLASSTTPAYLFDGRRYLVAYQTSDSEGGPDADHRVTDLRRRRMVSFVTAPYEHPFPPFRVSGAGELLREYGEVEAFAAGEERFGGRRLSTPGVTATSLALTGATAYWTEGDGARSATLDGPPAAGENHLLAPVSVPRGSGGACIRRRGRTIARSPRVRVFRRAGQRFACRYGRDGLVALPASGAVRILGRRWIVTDGADVTLHDVRAGKLIATATAATEWTLLAGGTLAWTTADGTLMKADSPAVVAEGATALASSGRTLYWTAGGRPHRLR